MIQFFLEEKAPEFQKKVHNKVNETLKIPMIKNKRSLNLASSVAIVLAEQLRQIRNY